MLCEGTGTNVFVVVDGRLVTPTLGSGCLAGVTRALLLDVLPEAEEADVPLGALDEASEAFLVSTAREVQPISHVDGRALPSCPGPLTRAARAAWVARYG
jgi:branched-chain amino acid aminotransferase